MTGQNNTSNPIAKATGLVQDGRCTTSNLVYEDGHSYNDFVPGQTYTITAEYEENNNYEGKVDVGELEILKRTTTTTLTTTTPTIEYNRNCVVNISVRDRNNNPVTTGSFTIYHSSGVIQSNCQVTGETTSVNITSQMTSLAGTSSGNDPVLLGTYQLYVVFTDTNNVYDNSRSNNINITVNKRATQINNTAPSTTPVMVDYGGSFSVNGYVSEVTGGAHVNNGNVILSDENGVYSTLNLLVTHNTGYSFTYSPSVAHDTSNHVLTLQFEGTGTTQASSYTFYYKYNKSDTHITTSNTSGYTHLNTVIPVSVQDPQNNSVQNGTLTLTIGGYSQTVNVTTSLTSITIPSNTLTSGTYTATLTYTAENNGIYNNSTSNLTLTLEDPISTNVTLLDTLDTTYYKGEEVTIRVLVTDDDDNPLGGLSVSAGWSRNTTTGVTDEDGIFTYNYTITTVGSRYNTFSVNVTEQLPYLSCSESYSSQLSNPTTLNNASMTATLVSATSDGVIIDVDLEDTDDVNSDGFTGKLSVYYIYSGSAGYLLGSKVLTSKTLSTRVECPPYETWIGGTTYSLQVSFKPDAPRGYVYSNVTDTVYAPYRTATHLTVNVPDPLYHGDGQRLGVTLTDGDNNPIPNKNIIVRVNNVDYTRSTNYNGAITGIPVSQLPPSSYPVVVSFTDENNVYANASETVTVTVQKQPTSITVDNEITVHTFDTFNIMGTLTNLVTSTTIQGATVYLEDDEGNRLSTTTTNSSGGFTFGYTPTIDTALLHVVYDGDGTISGVDEDVTVIYKPYFNIYARPNKEMLYQGDGCKLLITVTDQNDAPLPSGRNVIINIGGINYTRSINDNLGNASLNLYHDAGTYEYTVTVTDPQDSSITSSVSGTFTIHEIFTVSLPENIYYGEEALLGVTLEYNGTRIPNKDITIELTNPNSSYTVTTDSNGYASLDVSSQSVGIHGYTVTFIDPQGVYPSYTKTGSFEVKIVTTSVDCTTTDSWIRSSGRVTTSAMLDDDGYITCVRAGSNDYYTVCNDLVLQRDMSIEVDFLMKNSGTHGYGLELMMSNSPTRFFVYNGQLQEKHNGESNFTQNVASIPVNTLTTIKFEIDNDGYITLTDSSGSYTSNTAFTDTQLALMQFNWKHRDTDKSFSVRRLQYTGGRNLTQTFEWGDTLTNWKSTSGTTYLPSIVTQAGYTGVKAPTGQNNMSFHMSYLDIPLRLDTVTVLSCEMYIASGNNNKIGLFSIDNTYGDHQYNSTGMIQASTSNFETLNGTSATMSNVRTGAWVHAAFIIDGERNVTGMIEGLNNTIPSATVTVNTYDATDDTKNNRVYFGMHSAYPSYPNVLVRCIRIVQFPTQSD